MNIKSHTYEDIIFAQFYDFIVEKLNRGNAGKETWEFITYCAKIFGSPILKMGCGTGINLLELAEMGYTITLFDWRLYPMEDERLMQLIEQSGLHSSPVPTDLPINFHERFKRCAFRR